MNLSIDVKSISASSVFGACVGVATKRLTSDAMYGAGLGIIGLQVLSYCGYININWHAIERDLVKVSDQNGDGKLNSDDAKIAAQKFIQIMKSGIPNAAGFLSGFAIGVKFIA